MMLGWVLAVDGGEWLVTSKGAPEVMLRGPSNDEATLAAAESSAEDLTNRGYRVIAVADRAFGGEPLDPEVMHRPSRPPRESVFGGGLVRLVAMTGGLIAVVWLAVGLWVEALDGLVIA